MDIPHEQLTTEYRPETWLPLWEQPGYVAVDPDNPTREQLESIFGGGADARRRFWRELARRRAEQAVQP